MFQSINDHYHLHINHYFNFNENQRYELLSSLPPNIKNEMSMIILRKNIHKQNFLRNQLQDYFYIFKFQLRYKGDVLMFVGEIIEEKFLIFKWIYLGH